MKVFIILLVLVGIMSMSFTTQYVLAHGIHCGGLGCPIGGYGITDRDLSKTASDSMFYVSLIVYARY